MRMRMIEDMKLAGLSPGTQATYIDAVRKLVNTLMLQRVLAEPAWLARMTPADARALTPLMWGYVSPYGAFDLDMDQRLDLELRDVA